MFKVFFNFFLLASVVIGFVFILTTLNSKRGKDKSIIYLNLVVAFLVLNYLQIVILDTFYPNASYFVKMLRIPFYSLILPAYYSFITYYLNVQTKVRSYIIFSLGLFFTELLLRIVLFNQFYDDYSFLARYRQIEEIINLLFSLYLFIKTFVLLFKRQKLYLTILTFDNLKWLKRFMSISTIIMVSWVCAVILNLKNVNNPEEFLFYPLRFSCSILVFWLAYNGLTNYSLLTERIELREEISKDNTQTKKSSDNNQQFKNDKFITIENHIIENLSYLNPEFSLELLSSELKISVSSLSQIINRESNANFSDYINALRVKKAKELLVSPDFKEYTIISIGLECGFNSKSTFYLSFKKLAGVTPTEYRKQNSLV